MINLKNILSSVGNLISRYKFIKFDDRTKEEIWITGFVNFPIDNPNYINTKEGEMVVKLIVEIPNGYWLLNSFGGGNYSIYDSNLFIDNNCNYSKEKNNIIEYVKNIEKYEKYHFPRLNNDSSIIYKELSIPYAAILTIGATNWTGKLKDNNEYFFCKYDDLKIEGRILCRILQLYYPESKLTLQTLVG